LGNRDPGKITKEKGGVPAEITKGGCLRQKLSSATIVGEKKKFYKGENGSEVGHGGGGKFLSLWQAPGVGINQGVCQLRSVKRTGAKPYPDWEISHTGG